jgi:hypothetical protein
MTERRSTDEDGDAYGLGVWLYGETPALVGSDTGASFTSVHHRGRATWSVLGNTTEGAWPVVTLLQELLTRPTAPA